MAKANKNIEAIYPLSPMQQGMLFHTIYNPQSGAYFEQFSCRLKGAFERDAFSKAWHEVVRRHPALRTAFVYKKLDKMLQVVHKDVELPIVEDDWSALPETEQAEKFEQFLIADKKKGFNLSKAPLMRFHLMKRGEQDYYFLWSFHHLLTDGWSMPLILKEVFTLYEMSVKGFPPRLPAVRPYRDYINWLQKQDMEKAQAFWQEKLGDFSQPTPLVRTLTDPVSAETQTRAYKMQTLEIERDVFAKLQDMAKQNQLTMNTIVQSAWAFLLSRYSGQDDVLFGATVSGRPPELPGVENIVGLFINTLPIRVSLTPQEKISDYLKDVQSQAVAMREYEYTPLVEIQGWTSVPRDLPLFESIVVFENYPVDSTMKEQKLSFEISDVRSNEETNYPITLVAAAHETLTLEFAYESPLFEDAIIRSMLEHLQNFLTAVSEDPQRSLSSVPLLTKQERMLVTEEWNRTQTEFPEHLCMHQRFESFAEKQPQAKALQFAEDSLTYAELNARANHLAHHLRTKGVGPESTVAIYLERSFELIISLLAVLKAGGAYVPLDPNYPADRLKFIMEDSNAKLVITQKELQEKVQGFNTSLFIWEDEQSAYIKASTENPENRTFLENLAYMIYTSGSTGKPKGTLLQHRGAVNTAMSLGHYFQLEPGKSILQFASIGFDASVAEIFGALLNGAALHLISKETILSENGITDTVREQAISTVILPPSVLAILSDENLPDLHVVGSAGEACTPEILKRWVNGRTFVNGYGPTESTVAATLQPLTTPLPDGVPVPIGKPMHNAAIYVLDAYLNPQPVGVPGELHIASVGLARGYLHRADLTAEKFIPNPFSEQPGARLYKSGDLVRRLSDGSLEFMGRIDFQVKLRGFRIELGEIEAALTAYKTVRHAAVILREDEPGQKYLAAYITLTEDSKPDQNALNLFLKERLPDYMVPATVTVMDTFPLTSNGKIDRKKLPKPEGAALHTAEKIAPRTPVEELLVSLCQSILNVKEVGVNDNFFDLGGHSLLATQMMSRIRSAFEVELPLKDFFENPVISDLALKIETLRQTDQSLLPPPIHAFERNGNLPLSFAQQRLWFLDQLAPGSANYNIPTVLRLKGDLNLDALERSVREIVRRHESLRTTFSEEKGTPLQVIHETIDIPFNVVDLSALTPEEAEAKAREMAEVEAATPFDLSKGPLFRGMIIKLADQDHLALFTLHHTISDGWSMGILVREVATLYPAFLNDAASPLPDLTIQYADFAVWQRYWLQGEVLEKQLSFWKDLIGENPPVLELPTDFKRPAMQTFNGRTLHSILSPDLTGQLLQFSQNENATLFMTLLAAFQTMLYRYSGQDKILTGSPIANRTMAETEPLIGFFVNTLVLPADFSSVTDFRSLVKQIRQTTLQAYAHQDLPFEQLVEAVQPERDMSHSPLFQAAFILQNMTMDKLELPGLTLEPFEAESTVSKYDLTLNAAETEQGIECYFEYNTDLFTESTIQRMMAHFENLIRAILRDPKQKVDLIDFLTDQEKVNLFERWNQAQRELPQPHTVPAVFEALAQAQGAHPAAIFDGETLSYEQLNTKANQLAHHLLDMGLKPDQIVGISLPRSLDVPVAILAILKAGGAFLSIDPAYPQERIRYMMEDSGLRFLITQEALAKSLPINELPTIFIDRDAAVLSAHSTANPNTVLYPENLAYVIYTSGSTGKPKGTLLAHKGLVNLSQAQRKAFSIDSQSRILQFASLSFDASVWETAMALLNGATLVLADQETLTSGQGLSKVLEEQQVTTVTLPPSVLAVMPQTELAALQTIVTAGEKCTTDLVQRWGVHRQFVNAYGPTETTVCASMYETSVKDSFEPPIGKPVDNFQLYILDANGIPTAQGVPGELCIAGMGLARGYLNRPELTAEKFMPNPFSQIPGERIYRSGDLARWKADGNVEFLGRIDHQVKVRGFRIELGEIEATLTTMEHMRDVVVLAREDQPGDPRLVAYYIHDQAQDVEPDVFRSYLRQQLPEYMIPAIFLRLDEFPLTTSGKVDRKALPAPELSREALNTDYVAPRNETEEKLAEIISSLLHVETVGVHDNFFDLGGHSLLATQLISHLREEFAIELPLRKLFESPTIAGIAEAMLSPEAVRIDEDAPKLEAVERGDEDIESLLDEIDGLSDEEISSLLDDDE